MSSNSTMIQNPATGRENSKVRFLKRNKDYKMKNGKLKYTKKKGDVGYIKHYKLNGNLVQDDSPYFKKLGKNYQVSGGKLVDRVEKQVKNPVSKRMITVTGPSFTKMINSGYVYSRTNKKLYPPPSPTEIKTLIVDTQVEDPWTDTIGAVRGFMPSKMYIELKHFGQTVNEFDFTSNDMEEFRNVLFTSGGWAESSNDIEDVSVRIVKTKYSPHIRDRMGPSLRDNCVKSAFDLRFDKLKNKSKTFQCSN